MFADLFADRCISAAEHWILAKTLPASTSVVTEWSTTVVDRCLKDFDELIGENYGSLLLDELPRKAARLSSTLNAVVHAITDRNLDATKLTFHPLFVAVVEAICAEIGKPVSDASRYMTLNGAFEVRNLGTRATGNARLARRNAMPWSRREPEEVAAQKKSMHAVTARVDKALRERDAKKKQRHWFIGEPKYHEWVGHLVEAEIPKCVAHHMKANDEYIAAALKMQADLGVDEYDVFMNLKVSFRSGPVQQDQIEKYDADGRRRAEMYLIEESKRYLEAERSVALRYLEQRLQEKKAANIDANNKLWANVLQPIQQAALNDCYADWKKHVKFYHLYSYFFAYRTMKQCLQQQYTQYLGKNPRANLPNHINDVLESLLADPSNALCQEVSLLRDKGWRLVGFAVMLVGFWLGGGVRFIARGMRRQQHQRRHQQQQGQPRRRQPAEFAALINL